MVNSLLIQTRLVTRQLHLHSHIFFLFQMVATDQSLADSTIESEKANSSIHTSSQLLKHVNENFTPSFHQTLRQISSSQVLQLLAHERYVFIPYTTEKTMTNPRNFKKNLPLKT